MYIEDNTKKRIEKFEDIVSKIIKRRVINNFLRNTQCHKKFSDLKQMNNSQILGGAESDFNTPICHGDIVYLSFQKYFQSNKNEVNGLVGSNILEDSYVYGLDISKSILDYSIYQFLWQIESKQLSNAKNQLLKNKETQKDNRHILYGQSVYLKHLYSNQYLSFNYCLLGQNQEEFKISLQETKNPQCELKFNLAYKDITGTTMTYDQSIHILVGKTSKIFLNISENNIRNEYKLKAANQKHPFKINFFNNKNYFEETQNNVKIGDIVRIYNKNFNLYLGLQKIDEQYNIQDRTIYFKNDQSAKYKFLQRNKKPKYKLQFQQKKNLSQLWEILGTNNLNCQEIKTQEDVIIRNVATKICVNFNYDIQEFTSIKEASIIKIKSHSDNPQNVRYHDNDYYLQYTNSEKFLNFNKFEKILNQKWSIKKTQYKRFHKISQNKENSGIDVLWSQKKQNSFQFQKQQDQVFFKQLSQLEENLYNFYLFLENWGLDSNKNICFYQSIDQIKYLNLQYQQFNRDIQLILNNIRFANQQKFSEEQLFNIPCILIYIVEYIQARLYRSQLDKQSDTQFKIIDNYKKINEKLKDAKNANLNSDTKFQYENPQIIGYDFLKKIIKLSFTLLNTIKLDSPQIQKLLKQNQALFIEVDEFYDKYCQNIILKLIKFQTQQNMDEIQYIDLLLYKYYKFLPRWLNTNDCQSLISKEQQFSDFLSNMSSNCEILYQSLNQYLVLGINSNLFEWFERTFSDFYQINFQKIENQFKVVIKFFDQSLLNIFLEYFDMRLNTKDLEVQFDLHSKDNSILLQQFIRNILKIISLFIKDQIALFSRQSLLKLVNQILDINLIKNLINNNYVGLCYFYRIFINNIKSDLNFQSIKNFLKSDCFIFENKKFQKFETSLNQQQLYFFINDDKQIQQFQKFYDEILFENIYQNFIKKTLQQDCIQNNVNSLDTINELLLIKYCLKYGFFKQIQLQNIFMQIEEIQKYISLNLDINAIHQTPSLNPLSIKKKNLYKIQNLIFDIIEAIQDNIFLLQFMHLVQIIHKKINFSQNNEEQKKQIESILNQEMIQIQNIDCQNQHRKSTKLNIAKSKDINYFKKRFIDFANFDFYKKFITNYKNLDKQIEEIKSIKNTKKLFQINADFLALNHYITFQRKLSKIYYKYFNSRQDLYQKLIQSQFQYNIEQDITLRAQKQLLNCKIQELKKLKMYKFFHQCYQYSYKNQLNNSIKIIQEINSMFQKFQNNHKIITSLQDVSVFQQLQDECILILNLMDTIQIQKEKNQIQQQFQQRQNLVDLIQQLQKSNLSFNVKIQNNLYVIIKFAIQGHQVNNILLKQLIQQDYKTKEILRYFVDYLFQFSNEINFILQNFNQEIKKKIKLQVQLNTCDLQLILNIVEFLLDLFYSKSNIQQIYDFKKEFIIRLKQNKILQNLLKFCDTNIFENFLKIQDGKKQLIIPIIQKLYIILISLVRSQTFCKDQIIKSTTTHQMAKNFLDDFFPSFNMYYFTLFSCILFDVENKDVFNFFTKKILQKINESIIIDKQGDEEIQKFLFFDKYILYGYLPFILQIKTKFNTQKIKFKSEKNIFESLITTIEGSLVSSSQKFQQSILSQDKKKQIEFFIKQIAKNKDNNFPIKNTFSQKFNESIQITHQQKTPKSKAQNQLQSMESFQDKNITDFMHNQLQKKLSECIIKKIIEDKTTIKQIFLKFQFIENINRNQYFKEILDYLQFEDNFFMTVEEFLQIKENLITQIQFIQILQHKLIQITYENIDEYTLQSQTKQDKVQLQLDEIKQQVQGYIFQNKCFIGKFFKENNQLVNYVYQKYFKGVAQKKESFNLRDCIKHQNILFIIAVSINLIFIKKIKNYEKKLTEKKRLKIIQYQNTFDQEMIPAQFLQLFMYSKQEKFDQIMIKNITNFLKYGNKNVQNSLFCYLKDSLEKHIFYNKTKSYIKKNKNIFLTQLEKIVQNRKILIQNIKLEQNQNQVYIESIKTLILIFKLIQYLCENCCNNFQDLLCQNREGNFKINFLKITVKFYTQFLQILQPLLISNEKNQLMFIENKKYYQKLLNQIYSTIEDFLLGPNVNNINQINSNNNLKQYLKKFCVTDLNDHIQDQLAFQIFCSNIKIIHLMIANIQEHTFEQYHDYSKLYRILIQIYKLYIQPNKIIIQKDSICGFQNQLYQIKKQCKKCDFNICQNKKCTFLLTQLLEQGFLIYQILNQFENFKFKDNDEIYQFYKSRENTVEIFYKEKIIQQKFKIPSLCTYIDEDIDQNILSNTKRETHHEKIESFLENLPIHAQKMKQMQKIYTIKFLVFLIEKDEFVYYTRFFLTIALNIFIIQQMQYDDNSSQKQELIDMIKRNSISYLIYILLEILIIFILFIEIAINAWNQIPKIMQKEIQQTQKNQNQKKTKRKSKANIIYKIKQQIRNRVLQIVDVWQIILLLISFLALYYPWLWSIIMLDVVQKNKEMRDIVKSITLNFSQLIKTVFLGLIVMYIYAFIAFTYFPFDYKHEEGGEFQNYCVTLSSCFMSTVYNGIRAGGGIGEAIGHLSKDSNHYTARLLFDLSFFVIVIICLMNIIFGIIIDTFADLRDKRKEFELLVKTKCFICELDKVVVDKNGEGWNDHINESHKIESYVNYFIYLNQKNLNDCNGVEKHVKEAIKEKNYKFLPYLNCKAIQENKEKDENFKNQLNQKYAPINNVKKLIQLFLLSLY